MEIGPSNDDKLFVARFNIDGVDVTINNGSEYPNAEFQFSSTHKENQQHYSREKTNHKVSLDDNSSKIVDQWLQMYQVLL